MRKYTAYLLIMFMMANMLIIPAPFIAEANAEELIFDESYANGTIPSGWKFSHDDHSTSYVTQDALYIEQLQSTPHVSPGVGNSTFSFYISKDFESVLDEDVVNHTETVTTELSGKYELEFDMDYFVDSARSNKSLYFMDLGYRTNKNDSPDEITESQIEIRLGHTYIGAYHKTASGNKEWLFNTPYTMGTPLKMRIEFDTRSKMFSFYKNDVLIEEEMAYIDGTGDENVFSSMRLSGLQASSLDSYIQIRNIKIDRLEADLTDERYTGVLNILDGLPSSLLADPMSVQQDVYLPQVQSVQWQSGNTLAILNNGVLNRGSDDVDTYMKAVVTGESAAKTVPFHYAKKYKMSIPASMQTRTSTFDYPIWGDPYYMTDEVFFGKWSAAEQCWITSPLWDYDQHPGLADVEVAAKAGNYAEAKSALLDYYRPMKYLKTNPVDSISNSDVLRSELLGKNFYAVSASNGRSLDTFSVDNSWQDISIDVTNSIQSAAGVEDYRTFLINAIDKEKTHAEFYSKESNYATTLELVVNGIPMVLTAAKDATISAGVNSHINYGSDPIMLVQESGAYQNHDADTKRAYISFDLTEFTKQDVISSATLQLKGRNASGTGVKEMLLYQWANSVWQESEVTWNYFSEHMTFSVIDRDSWDYITSNQPAVKGKVTYFQRGDELIVPAKVFDYTDDEQYAYTFLRQIMALVNSVGVNTNVMNALDMSTHLNATSESIFSTIDSQYMTPEVFTALIKHLWMMADWEVENFYGTVSNNWGSFATLGVYSIIARFKELEKFDEWMDKTQLENERLLLHFGLDDGTSIELSQSYTRTLLGTLYRPIEIADLTNSPPPFNANGMAIIENMLFSFMHGVSPGFHGFHWGDSMDYKANSVVPLIKRFYETVFSHVDDFEFFATGGVTGDAPDFTSISFPDGLRTIMRSDWTDQALALQFTGKSEGSHGHRDITSLSMFAYGEYLLVDPAYGAILTGGVRDYMMSAQQHNLVTMNDKDQGKNADGILKAVALNDMHDFATYTTPLTQDADAHERSVLFDRDSNFWIVSDFLSPIDTNATQTYQQHWHMLPSANLSVDGVTKVARSNFTDVNVEVTPVGAEDITVTVEDTLFSPKAGSLLESKKAVYHKSEIGDVTYDAVIVPENIGENFSVTSTVLNSGLPQGAASSFTFQLNDLVNNTFKRFYYYHLNDELQKQQVSIGNYSTDATTMLIEENQNGDIEAIFLMDVTILEDVTSVNPVLFSSTVPVESISFRPNE